MLWTGSQKRTPPRPRASKQPPEAEGPHERCASTARSGRGTTTAPPRDPGTPPGPSGGVSESRPPTQENARRRPPAPGRGRRAPRRTGRPRAPPGTTRTRQVTDCTSLGRGRNPEKAGRRGGACGPHADPGPADGITFFSHRQCNEMTLLEELLYRGSFSTKKENLRFLLFVTSKYKESSPCASDSERRKLCFPEWDALCKTN